MVLWLQAPNICLFVVGAVDFSQFVGLTAMTATVISAVAILARNQRQFFLGNAPWAILAIPVVVYVVQYRSPLSSGLIQSLLSTDLRQLFEQLQGNATHLLIASTIAAGYLLAAMNFPSVPLWQRRLLVAVALWGCVLGIYLPYVGFELFHRYERSMDSNFIRRAFPLNVLSTAHSALETRSRLIQTPRRGVTVAPMPTNPQVYVLVIGESTRASTFEKVAMDSGLFDQHPDVVYFSDTLAQANYTDAAIPLLLTGKETLLDSLSSPSLIEIQNALGCLTATLSHNTSYASLEEAQILEVHANAGVTHLTRYDHDLLGDVAGLLSMSRQPMCIALHTVGSHYSYTARYRSRFERYPTNGTEVEQRRASYSNAVLMVQDFLGELIAQLRSTGIPSVLVYASDHGENLMEINDFREHVSHSPTEYELKVPLLFWASPSFVETYPRWEQLKANRDKPVSNRNVFATLLDLMGVAPGEHYPAADSLVRHYQPQPRRYYCPEEILHEEDEMLLDAQSYSYGSQMSMKTWEFQWQVALGQ